MRRRLIAFIALISLVTPHLPVATADFSVSKSFLMAFHACSVSDCKDIRNHQVYIAESDDGANWSLLPGWKSFIGSVPDVIRRGDFLYVYYVGIDNGENLYVSKYNMVSGSFIEKSIVRLSNDFGHFVDPSLSQMDDGKFLLTGLYVEGVQPTANAQPPQPSNPATCKANESTCIKTIKTASEIPGSDGAMFKLDSGARASITLDANTKSASDPDLFRDDKQWILYVSVGPSVIAYTGTDLNSEFTRKGFVSQNSGGIPSGFYQMSTGKIWTFVHTDQGQRSVIRRSIHESLSAPVPENAWVTVISAGSLGLNPDWRVESPGFAQNAKGKNLVLPEPTPTQTNLPSASQGTVSPSPSPSSVSMSIPPAPTLKPSIAPSATAVVKLKTIICVKGKSSKKVTGTNPSCPKGYVKK